MRTPRRRLSGNAWIAMLGITLIMPTAAQASPDKTVSQAMAAVQANRPDVLFAMLPPSYQQDLDGLVTAFAGRMDAQLWDQGRNLIGRAAKLMQAKRPLLLEMVQNRNAEANPADAGTTIDALAQLFTDLSTGPISDLQRLRQGNLENLLATEGRKIMQAAEKSANVVAGPRPNADRTSPWTMAKEAVVTLVNDGESQGTVSIASNGETETLDFTRVEGRWIPSDMAAEWAESMASKKEAIARMDYTTPEGQQQKMQAMMMLGLVNGILGQLEQANTTQEFQGALMGLMMMGGRGGPMAPPQPPAYPE